MSDKLMAELEALRADAARLDWVERHVTAIRDIGWLCDGRKPLRAAIDAARASHEAD